MADTSSRSLIVVEILNESHSLARDQTNAEQANLVTHLMQAQALEAQHLNDRQAMEKDQRILVLVFLRSDWGGAERECAK